MRGRTFVVASILCLLFVAAGLAGGSRDSIIEGRTGLLWVGDPQFAVSTGFAPDVVMPRAKALRMVAAMNRGALPNFGRRDWRLPTQRELKAWLRSQGLSTRIAPNSGVDAVRSWPVVGAATLPGVSAVAILATNSAQINKSAVVTGDMVVNDASAGPFLDAAAQLKLDRDSHVTGNLKSNSIRLDQNSLLTGNASYNTLSNGGSITGTQSTPLALPVFALLPVFQTSAPRPGVSDVSVGAGQTVTLTAGDYGHVSVAATGKLVLSGGIYNVSDVTTATGTGCNYPCTSIEATAGSDVRLAGRLTVGTSSFVGPQSGSGVDASQIVFYVGGINGTTGVLGATPSAAAVGRFTHLEANVYAPNGSVLVERDVVARGAFIGRDVRLGQSTTLQVASYFSNHPPVAIPGTAFTHGTGTITITLRGSDPDSDDLTFSIVSNPSHGSLSNLQELPPPVPPGDPERPQGDPPRTQATIDYTPAGSGNVEDSFVFRVTDTSNASGTAVVTINPPDSEEENPPPTTVVANDSHESTYVDRAVSVGLTAGAPAGVSVTFSILPATGPANGDLGTLVQGSESPQRSASAVYTPDSGFVGVDSFQFEACGVISGNTVCDSGTATVEVVAIGEEELAPDQSVSTPQDTGVTIGLGGSGSGTGTQFVGGAANTGGAATTRRITGKAAFLDPAEAAGNVADADDNGFGDNHNDLSSSAPLFVYAMADGDSGNGPGGIGTARIQIEWDISQLGPIGTGSTAEVTLTTNRGATDALDTYFFAGPGGNGTLEDSDFEAANLEQLQGVVMPVTGAQGADGTFTFDVKGALNDAIASGATFFTIQARVDESLTDGRGLGVYSTVDNPLNDGKVPALILESPPISPPPTYTVLSLASHGVLKDSANNIITAVPYELPDNQVRYTPNTGYTGNDTFNYQAELFATVDTGSIFLFINTLDCATTPLGCYDGR
jgi:hypothetical protein